MSNSLYDQDFVRWAEQQARAIRDAAGSGLNLPIDWENVAEEIESLGKSDRREVASRIYAIVEHLLKLEASPARLPRRGWEQSVRTQRRELRLVLKDSPSLRPDVPGMIAEALASAREEVLSDLAARGEPARIDIHQKEYTESQVLDTWFPDPISPAEAPRRRARNR
jgi:hypothetical protein